MAHDRGLRTYSPAFSLPLNNPQREHALGHRGSRTMIGAGYHVEPVRPCQRSPGVTVGVVLDGWASLHLVLCSLTMDLVGTRAAF